MPAPVFRISANLADKTLTYDISGVEVDVVPSRERGTAGPLVTHRTIQSKALDEVSKAEGPLQAAFLAAVQRKAQLDAEADRAARAAWGASALAILTLFLVPSLRSRAAELKERAAEARKAAGVHAVRFEFENGRSDLAEAWKQTVLAAGTAAMKSQRIWDLTSQSRVNQRRERSTAATSITRSPVTMAIEAPRGLDIDVPLLRLGNVNGHPLYVGPTFIVTGTSPSDYILIDLRAVQIEHRASQFHETDGVPSDSNVVGHTWRYANKSGGRDRRYKDNHQIPIARYYKMILSTSSGLDEGYMFSNAEAGAKFAISLQALITLLCGLDLRMGDGATS